MFQTSRRDIIDSTNLKKNINPPTMEIRDPLEDIIFQK